MNKNTFVAIVVLVVVFVGWALVAGNRLPAELRTQIQTEQKQLKDSARKIAEERATVASDAAGNPELFHVRNFDQTWPGRFLEANVALGEAQRYDSRLQELLRKNSRSTRAEVEDLLKRSHDRQSAALSEADGTLKDAQMRVDLKRDFPQTLAKIDSGAKTLAAADYATVTAKVEKAEQDWPSKKDVLRTRLDALVTPEKEASQWESAAKTLEAKPAAELSADDYAKALDLEESVAHAPGEPQAHELEAMSHQLYTSWDNILDDLDKEHDEYRERIKHVVTTVPAPNEKGQTTSSEMWEPVSQQQWKGLENNIGMTIAHKPLGRFDSESDHTPEPAGFAYMASPAEGRNQYGYWDNRGGASVWTWLPEYLILRDLLTPRYYQPIPSYEWGRYQQARRYGQTYYGRDESGAPKYGSHGTFTARSYANSRYVQSGGFSSSKYTSSGGFSGSKYGSGGASASSSASGQRFGSSSASGSAPKRFGGSSSGRSFGSSHSAGRSFGGRRH